MTDRLDFETRLEERLRARAAIASRPFDAAAIARGVVAIGRGRTAIRWPSRSPVIRWLVIALLAIALCGAVAAFGALLQSPKPVPLEQLAVIRAQVAAINGRDTNAFVASFAPDGIFFPSGIFEDNRSLFPLHESVAETARVAAWMSIQEAWGFEADILSCREISPDEAIRYTDGPALYIKCDVATRWRTLSLEIRQAWQYEFHGGQLLAWDFELGDLDPSARGLPLGYPGLDAWEAWLRETDPTSAARYLNPRDGGCTEADRQAANGCWEYQEALAPDDPVLAATLVRLLNGTQRSWSINGLIFNPRGLIPYDPAYAAEIEASIQEFLRR